MMMIATASPVFGLQLKMSPAACSANEAKIMKNLKEPYWCLAWEVPKGFVHPEWQLLLEVAVVCACRDHVPMCSAATMPLEHRQATAHHLAPFTRRAGGTSRDMGHAGLSALIPGTVFWSPWAVFWSPLGLRRRDRQGRREGGEQRGGTSKAT